MSVILDDMRRVLRSWQARLVAAVYVAGTVVGLLVPLRPSSAEDMPQFTSFASAFLMLVKTNVGVELTILIGGVLTFGIVSIAVLGLNGFVLGATWRLGLAMKSPLLVLKGTAFHFLPEITGLLLAGYVGLQLAGGLVSVFRRERPAEDAVPDRHLLRVVGVMIGLTILAAVIESIVGVYLMSPS